MDLTVFVEMKSSEEGITGEDTELASIIMSPAESLTLSMPVAQMNMLTFSLSHTSYCLSTTRAKMIPTRTAI